MSDSNLTNNQDGQPRSQMAEDQLADLQGSQLPDQNTESITPPESDDELHQQLNQRDVKTDQSGIY